MNNKFFSYSFQISNTKKIIILIFILSILGLVGYFVFLNRKSSETNINKLYYTKMLGMEKFESNSCEIAYKFYYKKKTCGSVCINVLPSNPEYLTNLKNNMTDNGFEIDGIKGLEINGDTWDYFETTSTGPIFKYYASIYDNKLYSVELIKQNLLLSKNEKSKCENDFKTFENSLKLK